MCQERWICQGGCWKADEEEMAVEPTRVKKTKFSAAGGLRNIILTITFFVLRAGHTERPLFDNFIKVDLYRFFSPNVQGGTGTPDIPKPITIFGYKNIVGRSLLMESLLTDY